MKKNILFITYSLSNYGGVENVLTNIANELSEIYNVTIICLDGQNNFVYKTNPNVEIIILNSYGTTKSYKTMILMNKYLSWLPKKNNIKTYVFQYGVYKVLGKWLKVNHQKYDSIITCRYQLASMLSLIKEIAKKTYAWEHVHYKIGGLFWDKLMRPKYKNLKGIICLNKESRKHYETLNKNTHLIPNIIGEPFESTSFILEEKKENIILFVGRLHPEKNSKELTNIFYNLKSPKDWKLYIIGDGSDKGDLQDFIQQNNISNIRLLDAMKKEEVYQYMKKSKILALTSETESFGLVLLEAMFCSHVLVSYDCEFGPANIINDKNGFLIPLHDQKAFGEKLQYLIDNEDVLKSLNQSSYNEAQKWKKQGIIDQWEKTIDS